MNKTFIKALLLSSAAATMTGCSYFDVPKVIDPNFPSLESVTANATKNQLDALSTGVFSDLRTNSDGIVWYYQISGIIGREVYVLATSDSRYVTEPLGTIPFDNNDFLSGRYFTTYSSARRTARILASAANNSTFVTAEQKNAYIGLAKTAEAYAMLVLSDFQYDNGLRVDVADPVHPGKIQPYPVVLAAIKTLLDDGYNTLGNAGTALPFTAPTGYGSTLAGQAFNTVNGFRQFNRALAARLAIRQTAPAAGNNTSAAYADARAALTAAGAFYSNDGLALTAGPRFNYGGAAPDVTNPLFQTANSSPSVATVVNPAFRRDIRPGDTRINKIAARTTALTRQGLTGADEVRLYPANNAPIPIIKREELLLISAEARANTGDLPGALVDLNKVATGYGLAAYNPATPTVAGVMNEILYQRRYSLFYEGQRWVDLRRLGRLADLNVPGTSLPEKLSTGQQTTVLTKLPLPYAEVTWDIANP